MTYVPKTNIVTKPKQPAALAKLKGTYQKCRHEDQIADSLALDFIHETIPLPPAKLPEQAKKYWITQLNEAAKVYGYVGKVDLNVFEQLCKVYAEMIEMEEEVKGKTKIMKGKNGQPIVNPYYVLLSQTRDTYLKLCREFGFTPSSRTRIRLEQQKEEIKEPEYQL